MRSVLLVVLSATLVVAVACQREAPAPGADSPPFRVTSSVREVMQSIVAPSAQGLWESVGTISSLEKGTVTIEPKTDADWAAVRRHAVTLVEATSLLMIPGRQVASAGASALKADEADPGAELHPEEIQNRIKANWGAWTGMALALHDAATSVLRTIDKKDVAGLEGTGSDLDAVCESCHLTFWYPPNQAK